MDWLENRLETITSEEEESEIQGTSGAGGGNGREEEVARTARREKANITERVGPTKRTSPPKAVKEVGTTARTTAAQPQSTTQPQVQAPRSSTTRTSSSSPPSSTAYPKPSSQTRSRTKGDKHLRNASSFVFNAPLPTATVNPFDHDFGSQHLMDHSDGPLDHSFVVPEIPQPLVGSKRRHSAMAPEPVPGSVNSVSGPSSSGRNAGQASAPGKRRLRGGGSSGRVTVESLDAMDTEELAVEPARKKVARR